MLRALVIFFMRVFARFLYRLFILIACIFALGTMLFFYFIQGIHLEKEVHIGKVKTNAVWMAHEWVGQAHHREIIHSLVTTLMRNQISLAFLHSGPIESDGSIPKERHAYAQSFLTTAKQIAPEIEFHAWIGQVRDKLPLEDAAVREKLVEEAVYLVEEVGFDGIHVNVEPMQGDPEFEVLLGELRAALEQDVGLSAAVSPIVPELPLKMLQFGGRTTFFGHDLNREYSSLKYTRGLAEHLDYVALMGYDTSFKDIEMYEWFMEQELIFLMKAAPGKALMGIPSYEDERDNFDPEVENVETALRGIHRGLANIRTNVDDLAGLAIYARWTTDEDEWGVWQDMWLTNDLKDNSNE